MKEKFEEKDTEEIKTLKEKLIATEKKLSAILDNMPDMFFRTDIEGKILIISPAVKDIFGYEPDEMIGISASEFFLSPELHDNLAEVLNEGGGGVVKDHEALLKCKDDSVIWGAANARYWTDENGDIGGIEGVARDITVRKEAEEALKKKNIELQKALDEVKQLKGFLPVCTSCKNIRDDHGYWESIELYISNNSDAVCTNSLCPDCEAKAEQKYAKINLPNEERIKYAKMLEDYMDKEQAFLEENLSLRQVSEKLNIPRHYISMTINIEFGQNFYNYVNSFRIKYSEKLLKNLEEGKEPILMIAYRSGFQSKNSFNKAFKSLNGMTPSEYRKNYSPEVP